MWKKACDTSACVEVLRPKDNMVLVRSTEGGNSGILVFDDEEWTQFLQGAKEGKFDVRPVA